MMIFQTNEKEMNKLNKYWKTKWFNHFLTKQNKNFYVIEMKFILSNYNKKETK
jgi:hypothetical protein